ncbi:MAG: 3-deoxy-8-phosphooctulonate synthase [Chthoniobacterales bacterium]
MKAKPFKIGPVTVGGRNLLLILGPCVLESEKSAFRSARKLKEITRRLGVPFIFKASYDKANRTSSRSFRGPGLSEGCAILGAIRRELGVPVTTDVHSSAEVDVAAEHVDLLQIPAFLCRQTDLIKAAGQSGRAVNVKKGQFLSPWEIAPIAEKLRCAGCKKFLFTERGTTFGYNNLVADMRSIPWVQEQGYHVVFDATHSVQRPGGGGDRTTGDGKLAPILAAAAVAAGVDGVFLETHENPSKAPSDGPNQIPLAQMPSVLRKLLAVRNAL